MVAGSDRARQRLLVLGAGPAQIGLLRAARERDLFVIAVDRDPAAPGFAYADKRAIVSTEDEPGVDRLARAENVDGIISPGADWPVGVAARVAERLALPHPIDAATATLATTKSRQRDRFADAGVPQPRSQLVSGVVDGLPIPCVVKAPDRQGQRGLSLVRSEAELPAAIAVALEASRGEVCLVEELVEGPEVTVNAVSIDGVFHPLLVTDRVTADPPAFGVALAHVWPCVSETQAPIEAARAAAEALGVRNGPTYTQIRVGPDGSRVVELAARLGGGHDAELAEAATGVKLNDLALDFALGNEACVSETQSLAGGACVLFLVAPEGIAARGRGSRGGARGRRGPRRAALPGAGPRLRPASPRRRPGRRRDRGRRQPRAGARARSRRRERNTLRRRMTREQPLGFQPPSIGEEEIEAVAETLRSGWLTTGPRAALLEERMAEYLEAKHVLAVASGTAAMHLALVALGIEAGDEVITTPITWPATANVIVHSGATPVFVDVREGDLNIDPALIGAAVTERTKAIMPVHLAGQPADMDPIWELGIPVIEDAAHAAESAYRGRKLGGLSEATCFSLYATKNIAAGEGGLVSTNSDEVADAIRNLRLMRRGDGSLYDITVPGYKANLSDVLAAIALVQLDKLPEHTAARERQFALYDEGIAGLDGIEPLERDPRDTHALHLYVVRVDAERFGLTRDEVQQALAAERISTSIHFLPVHRLTWYRERFPGQPSLPVAERAGDEILSLPLSPAHSDGDIADVIEALGRIRDRTT